MNNVTELLKKAAGEVLTEETLASIESAFNTAVADKAKAEGKTLVETQVKERLTLEVENALARQDDEHAVKLEKLLEAIDADHVKKLKAVVGKIDENHSGKLTWLVKKYRKQMQTEASQLRDTLTTQISNYLDLYLEKTVPQDQISEAVQNIQARKMIDNIKKIISVDSSFVTEQIREALMDGKAKIDNLKKELDQTIQENVDLNQKAKGAEAARLLVEKTMDLPEDKKTYVKKVLAEKDPEYITENFDYVVEMFERDQQDEVELLREGAKGVTSKQVDQPVITESSEADEADVPVTGYLSELKKFDSRHTTAA